MVLASFRQAIGALRRNPVIIALSVAFGVLQVPSFVAQEFSPVVQVGLSVGSFLVSVLVVPFVFAGMIGVCDEALDGQVSLGTFLRHGRDNYLAVLGAYLLLIVTFGIFSVLTSIVGGLLAAVIGASVGGTTGFTVGVVVFGLSFLAVLLPAFFVQFFGHAIVLDDAGVGKSFRRSVGVVRRNLRVVAVYFGVVFAIGLVGGLVGGIQSVTTAPGIDIGVADTTVLVLQTVGVLLTGIVSSVFWPFSVAIYRRITSDTDSVGDGASPAPTTPSDAG